MFLEKLTWLFLFILPLYNAFKSVLTCTVLLCLQWPPRKSYFLAKLFHKRHLLSESEIASHSGHLLFLVSCSIFHKAKVTSFCFRF